MKNSIIQRLNNTLQNNQQITKEIKICIETNENENTTTPKLCDTVKAVLRGRFIAIQAYLKKQAKSQITNLTLHLRQLEKEEMKNPGVHHFFFFQLRQVQSQVYLIYLIFLLFLEVSLYCYEPSPQHCFYSVPQVWGCCVFIFISFYAYFDFFCDLLVIQKCVVQPPYGCIFNSFFFLQLTYNLTTL